MPQVFRLSPIFQRIGLTILVSMGLLYGILIPAGILEEDLLFILALFSFTLPFFLLGIYWAVRHSGHIILTQEGITLNRWGREKHLKYNDIIAFQERDAHIPPNYTLKTADSTLKFSRNTENFPELHSILRKQIPLLNEIPEVDFPWTLKLSPSFLLDIGLGALVLFSVVGAIAYFSLRNSEILFEDIFFMSLAGILVLILFVGAALPEIRSAPLSITFTADKIQVKSLIGAAKTFDARHIRSIYVGKQVQSTQIRGRWVWRRINSVVRPIIIKFDDGAEFTLDENRTWQFGYSPEYLLAILKHLYTPKNLGQQLLGRKS